jgi:hypothetical protein
VGVVTVSAYRGLPVASRIGSRLWIAAPAGWALTMLYVGIGWLFFFYPVNQAFLMARQLFGFR